MIEGVIIENMHIYQRFKSASPAVKASIALFIANLVLKGLSLISGPIFTRIMDSTQYGIVSTFLSWQGVLSAIITLNLSAGVFNNGMSEFKEDRDTFQFSLLAISSISTLLWFLIFVCVKEQVISFFELPEASIYLMFLYFLFVPAYSFWGGRQRYEYKYKPLSIITVLIAVFSLFFGVIAVLISDKDNSAMSRLFVMEGINIFVGIIMCVLLAIKSKLKVNFYYCIYALKFNVPLIPHYLSMYVLSSSDRIMIMKLISPSATAIYSVAYTVASVITIVWQSIEASLSPWIYEKLETDDIKSVKKMTLDIVLLFAVMSMMCTLFAPEIMKILAPLEYSSGIYVIPPIAAGVFFTAMYSLYMRIELFYKQTGFAAIATTLTALINILLNYVFIKIFGAVAAGYTTMVCYALLAVAHYVNVRKKGYAHIIDNRLFLLVASFVIGEAVIMSLVYDYLLIRILLITILMLILLLKKDKILNIINLKK